MQRSEITFFEWEIMYFGTKLNYKLRSYRYRINLMFTYHIKMTYIIIKKI